MDKIRINLSLDKKKKLIIIISSITLTILLIAFALYITNQSFRSFLDRHILRKEITENGATSIDISDQENASIYAFDSYISILNKNKLTLYTTLGKKEKQLDVNISEPLYASHNRFLVVAQKNGQNLYCVSDGNIMWQKEVEGQIQKIDVNKNGYVTVAVTGTNYNMVISTYNTQGKELFKTYLSNSTCIDTSISNDNKYLAIAEVNTSGTLIQSSIKIISIEKAQTDPTNSVIDTYQATSGQLIKNVQYQDKNYLISMYDNEIRSLYKESDEQSVSLTDNKITFASIKLDSYIVYTNEKNTSLFNSNTQVSLKNGSSGKENIYLTQGTVKDIKTYANHIALNMGSEIHFVTTNGWLTKKYTSEKEVKDIVLGDKIAGVVYKDKIDIVNL